MIQDNYRFIPFPCDSCLDNCVLAGSKSNICDKLVQYNVAVLERQLERMTLEDAKKLSDFTKIPIEQITED